MTHDDARPNSHPIRSIVLASLGRGARQIDAARDAGVSRSTVGRLLAADPSLRDDIAAERFRLIAETARALDEAAPRAVTVLDTIAAEGDTEANRVRAAGIVLAQQADRLPLGVLADHLHRLDAENKALRDEVARLRAQADPGDQ